MKKIALLVAAAACLVKRQQLLVLLTVQIIIANDALLVFQFGNILLAVVSQQTAYYCWVVGSRVCAYHHTVWIYRRHLHRRMER